MNTDPNYLEDTCALEMDSKDQLCNTMKEEKPCILALRAFMEKYSGRQMCDRKDSTSKLKPPDDVGTCLLKNIRAADERKTESSYQPDKKENISQPSFLMDPDERGGDTDCKSHLKVLHNHFEDDTRGKVSPKNDKRSVIAKKPFHCDAGTGQRIQAHDQFDQSCDFTKHQKSHLIKDKELFKCEVCGKKYSYRGSMSKHQQIHLDGKPLKCKTCGRKDCLQKHSAKKLYKCELCGKGYQKKRLLKMHQQSYSDEKPLMCEKRFHTLQNLSVHQQGHCGKKSGTSEILEHDLQTDILKKPYKCEVCGRRFSHKVYLSKHQPLHHGERPHKCELCGKSFCHKSQISLHLRRHAGEKPYECELCRKRFHTCYSLSVHLRIHNGEKAHMCELCGKRFLTRTHLSVHHRTHSGEKPYKCNVCGSMFRQTGHLSAHLQSHIDDRP